MRFLLRLAYNLLRLITWPLWGLFPRFRRKRSTWVSLRIQGELELLPHARGQFLERLVQRFRPTHLSVLEVQRLVSEIVDDPQATGLVLTLASVRGGWATLESLRNVLSGLTAAGKRLVVALPQGADQRELWISSVADYVCTSEPASFTALGLAAQRPYLAGLLSKLGIKVQVFAQGNYKTAAEALSREHMSDAEREQLEALLGTLQTSWLDGVAKRQRVGPQNAARALEQAMFGPHDALALGFVDRVCYADELEAELDLEEHPAREHRGYLISRRRRLFVPLTRPSKVVALVRLHGAIGSAPNPRGISLAATRRLLRGLREDPRVVGVILHIDSPGGSAVASDLLHREVVRLDQLKPVVAWMGNIAASGGYYLAVAARAIVAQPTTITGSIGVISARPVAHQLLDRLGVRNEVVKLAPHADLHSLREVDEGEAALLHAETRRYYERFLSVVAEGRKRSVESVAPYAGGRVWSGADAHRHGLVDHLGGYPEARAVLDRLLGAVAKDVALEPELAEPSVQASRGAAMATEAVWGTGRRPPLECVTALASLALLKAQLEAGERVLTMALPLEIS